MGIPRLRAVSLGTDVPQNRLESYDSPLLFAIKGTIAHLQCRVAHVYEHAIDVEHLLVLAQVERAWVRSDYWNGAKNVFGPVSETASPYLTFLGSQTFGYVVSQV
jgi:flavin reductase (DIM6/NTAB) family NADH-FMN oxidoreductase RutF